MQINHNFRIFRYYFGFTRKYNLFETVKSSRLGKDEVLNIWKPVIEKEGPKGNLKPEFQTAAKNW